MATISSHVLDSLRGDHARGIRIDCNRIQGGSAGALTKVFSVSADAQGRISESVEINADADERFELVFHAADYFSAFADSVKTIQIMPEVVVRLALPSPETRYHLPLVLSPHSYTLWWSGVSDV